MYLLLISLVVGLMVVRSSSLLSNFFESSLNTIGLQLGDQIYTPVSRIQCPAGDSLDLVLLGHRPGRIHGYRILHHHYFELPLHYVPIGHTLIYLDRGEEKPVPYLTGSPFQLDRGELILRRKRRKGLGFVEEEVARGTTWPLQS